MIRDSLPSRYKLLDQCKVIREVRNVETDYVLLRTIKSLEHFCPLFLLRSTDLLP